MNVQKRCEWAMSDALNLAYHDLEWGVPVHNDRKLFEMLILEGAQAGLSWTTILKKREGYRRAFDSFDFKKISNYNDAKVQKLLLDSGIIRNRLKISATIQNAKAFLTVRKEFGTFDNYIWQFADGEAEAMSRDLQRRGFRFVGPTICYALMQAVGMVNDHQVNCFRYTEV